MGKSRAAIAHDRRSRTMLNAERLMAAAETGNTPVTSAIDFVMDLLQRSEADDEQSEEQ